MDLDFIHMPMQDVFKYREELKQQMQVLKDKQSLLNEELSIRFGNTARNKLNEDGKDYGSVTLNEQGYKVKVTLRQKVTWDQQGLATTLLNMDQEEKNLDFLHHLNYKNYENIAFLHHFQQHYNHYKTKKNHQKVKNYLIFQIHKMIRNYPSPPQ